MLEFRIRNFCFCFIFWSNRVITSSLDGRPPTSYNVFDSTFNNIDSNGNWAIKARNLNLQNGFIHGRSDGYNFTGTSNNKYVGYCLFVDATPREFVSSSIFISLAASPALQPGVYLISGVIIVDKNDAVYLTNTSFNAGWATNTGTVASTSNVSWISSSDVNLRAILPTSYLIITNTGGGTVWPRYAFQVSSGASTATIAYEISIIRIA